MRSLAAILAVAFLTGPSLFAVCGCQHGAKLCTEETLQSVADEHAGVISDLALAPERSAELLPAYVLMAVAISIAIFAQSTLMRRRRGIYASL